MCTYEFFPKNNAGYRKDRNVNGGGVFVATSDRIISYEASDLDTDCEMICTELQFSGSKPLYLASIYKITNTTLQPLEAFASCYNKQITLHKRSPRNTIIWGDFNLPGNECTNKARHEVLLKYFLDH